MAIFTAVLSWKLSGEVFSETKFLRLVLASFALALGFNISGTPLTNVAVNPFASALAGLLFSKGLNYIKEVPTQLLSQIEGIVRKRQNNYLLQIQHLQLWYLQFLPRVLHLKYDFFSIFFFFPHQ